MKTNNMDQPEIMIKTRFAPSPTGIMHFGNIRTAIFNYLFAKNKAKNGEFIIRIEDTDRERSKAEYTLAILQDLETLGLKWDGTITYQAERADVYESYYQQLIKQDLIYRCFCPEEKLNLMRKVQLSQGLPPRYAGNCFKLTEEEIKIKLANKEAFCWRFKIPKNTLIEFDDLVKGKHTFNSNDFGDFVIRRQDGTAPFMFCNAIDDSVQGVTHALRGEDHLTNTPRQLLILRALNLTPPQYGHFPLINGIDGLPLSKRGGSKSIRELLEEGYLPQTILNYLARLGHSYILEKGQENTLLSLEQLAIHFNIKHISLNAARHDINHLNFWQKQVMMVISNKELLKILEKNPKFIKIFKDNHNKEQLTNFLELVKVNIVMPQEALIWANALFADHFNDLDIAVDAQNVLKNIDVKFLNTIINMPDHTTFAQMREQLTTAGFVGKNLFVNLRVVFTGQVYGPELNKIFEMVGMQRIKQRSLEILQQMRVQ